MKFIVYQAMEDLATENPKISEDISGAFMELYEELSLPADQAGRPTAENREKLELLDNFCRALCGYTVYDAYHASQALGCH